jgi:hypothetical protein
MLKAPHTRNQKTRANIATMNAALSDVVITNLPKTIHNIYEPICMEEPNTVFQHMLGLFIKKYGKVMTKERKEYLKNMATNWHPSDGLEPLGMRLFIGVLYVSAVRYPMEDCGVINIGLHIVKSCSMYSKEYKKLDRTQNRIAAYCQ